MLERKVELEALRHTGQAEEMEWASKNTATTTNKVLSIQSETTDNYNNDNNNNIGYIMQVNLQLASAILIVMFCLWPHHHCHPNQTRRFFISQDDKLKCQSPIQRYKTCYNVKLTPKADSKAKATKIQICIINIEKLSTSETFQITL